MLFSIAGCPRGHNKAWCVMDHYRVSWNVKYVFVNKKYCRKVVTKRIAPIHCRHVRILATSKRCFKLYGNHKYGNEYHMKITVAYAVMRKCRCFLKLKNIFEPCRCFKKKRWIWVRHCRRICQRVCTKTCYKMRVWLTYKIRKRYHGGKKIVQCIPKPVFKQKFRCCKYTQEKQRLFNTVIIFLCNLYNLPLVSHLLFVVQNFKTSKN